MSSPRSRCRAALALCAATGLAACGTAIHRAPHLVRGPPRGIRPAGGGTVSVVCWNLHKRTDSVLVSDLSRLLDSTRADLALFQEAVVDSGRGGFVEALGGREWALSANLLRSPGGREIGVATASAIPFEEASAVLSEGTEPLAGTPKAALVTRHRFGARVLLVANLHALNFSPLPDGFRRQLAVLADTLRRAGGPALAAGDFNTWSRRKRDLADSLFAAAGLVRLDFGEQEGRKTAAFGNALDQIYYTPDRLEVDSSTVRVHTGIRSSDHVPLSAAFRILPGGDAPR